MRFKSQRLLFVRTPLSRVSPAIRTLTFYIAPLSLSLFRFLPPSLPPPWLSNLRKLRSRITTAAIPRVHYVTTDEMRRDREFANILVIPIARRVPLRADWIITGTTSPTVYLHTDSLSRSVIPERKWSKSRGSKKIRAFRAKIEARGSKMNHFARVFFLRAINSSSVCVCFL